MFFYVKAPHPLSFTHLSFLRSGTILMDKLRSSNIYMNQTNFLAFSNILTLSPASLNSTHGTWGAFHLAQWWNIQFTYTFQNHSLALMEVTHNELIATQNKAYMQVYAENLKLQGSVETLQYIFFWFCRQIPSLHFPTGKYLIQSHLAQRYNMTLSKKPLKNLSCWTSTIILVSNIGTRTNALRKLKNEKNTTKNTTYVDRMVTLWRKMFDFGFWKTRTVWPSLTVGIVQCKVDSYVNFIRKVFQKCLKCCCVKYSKLIHNVIYNEERICPQDTLWIYLQYHSL